MGKITGGSVTYERNSKIADYESHKAAATISFGVDENETDGVAMLDNASALAMAKVYDMLKIKLPASHIPPASGKRTAGRPSNAQKAQAAVKANISTGEARKDPASVEDVEEAPTQGANGSGSSSATADPAAVVEEWEVVEETKVEPIPDTELMAALQSKNKELGDPAPIRALVAKYAPAKEGGGPARAPEIPQEKRRAFLDEIKALKKAA